MCFAPKIWKHNSYSISNTESIYKFDEISNDNELFTTVYLQGKICALVMIADSRIIG